MSRTTCSKVSEWLIRESRRLLHPYAHTSNFPTTLLCQHAPLAQSRSRSNHYISIQPAVFHSPKSVGMADATTWFLCYVMERTLRHRNLQWFDPPPTKIDSFPIRFVEGIMASTNRILVNAPCRNTQQQNKKSIVRSNDWTPIPYPSTPLKETSMPPKPPASIFSSRPWQLPSTCNSHPNAILFTLLQKAYNTKHQHG